MVKQSLNVEIRMVGLISGMSAEARAETQQVIIFGHYVDRNN